MSRVADCVAVGLGLFLFAGACSSHPSQGTGGTGGGLGPHGLGGEPGAGGTGAGGQGTGGLGPDGGGGLGSGGSGDGGLGGAGGGGAGGQDAGSPTDAVVCCPADPGPIHGEGVTIGGVRLGGAKTPNYACGLSYDFVCTKNWRLETDAQGCPIWRSDFDHACSPPDGSPPPDADTRY